MSGRVNASPCGCACVCGAGVGRGWGGQGWAVLPPYPAVAGYPAAGGAARVLARSLSARIPSSSFWPASRSSIAAARPRLRSPTRRPTRTPASPTTTASTAASSTIELVVTDTGFFASGADAGPKEILATENEAQVTFTLTNRGTTGRTASRWGASASLQLPEPPRRVPRRPPASLQLDHRPASPPVRARPSPSTPPPPTTSSTLSPRTSRPTTMFRR